MKIAYYSPSWPPGNLANGINTYLSQIVPEMRSRGYEVFILTPEAREADPYTIDISKFRKPWHRDTEILKPLLAAVKHLVFKRGLGLIEMDEAFGLSRAVSKLKLLPVVLRLHGPWFLNKRFEDAKREEAEADAILQATAISAPSKSVLEATRSRIKFERATKILNPISPSADRWQPADKNSLLFIGRCDHIKGADLVLEAFKKLRQTNPALRLTIAGPDHINIKASLPDGVIYLGEVKHSETAGLRREHFITISASRYEVFGYTVAEAMAQGCPIVAPKVGGIPEMVEHERSGLLFEAGNADALAANCQRFLDDPALAERCGAQAIIDCAEKLDRSKIGWQTEYLYESTIQEFRYGYPL